jgi:ribosomal protein S18 acetylase RimI-like enzyme
MIKTIDLKHIKLDNPYYSQITELFKMLRPHKPNIQADHYINKPAGKLMLIIVGSKLVSSLRYRRKKSNFDGKNIIYINMVWTHPDYRQRGYSSTLFKTLIKRSRTTLALDLESDNTKALNLYKSFGFVVKKKYSGYDISEGVEYLYMEK